MKSHFAWYPFIQHHSFTGRQASTLNSRQHVMNSTARLAANLKIHAPVTALLHSALLCSVGRVPALPAINLGSIRQQPHVRRHRMDCDMVCVTRYADD